MADLVRGDEDEPPDGDCDRPPEIRTNVPPFFPAGDGRIAFREVATCTASGLAALARSAAWSPMWPSMRGTTSAVERTPLSVAAMQLRGTSSPSLRVPSSGGQDACHR
ncbi:hypothetical protein I4F81_009683 [Pyropia yezoensis]|uniref:Uncharacterized protein n=1 Tax=Pyropia yezoensis TaxID=2788 RepID=A0ACC3CB48_PYRYE|nr:hypothetical protein I4F81_009683 [Neopyropia yezoensis]